MDSGRPGDRTVALLDDPLDFDLDPLVSAGLVERIWIAQYSEGHGLLAFEGVADSDDCRFRHSRMRIHGFLDLACAEAVSSHIDDIVGTAQDIPITIVVDQTPVGCGIQQVPGKGLKIGVDEAFVIPPDRAHGTGWQWRLNCDHAFLTGAAFLARGLIDHFGVKPIGWNRWAAKARFHFLDTGLSRQDGPTDRKSTRLNSSH